MSFSEILIDLHPDSQKVNRDFFWQKTKSPLKKWQFFKKVPWKIVIFPKKSLEKFEDLPKSPLKKS